MGHELQDQRYMPRFLCESVAVALGPWCGTPGRIGAAFGVDVDLFQADDQANKDLAVGLAKLVVTRI